MYYNYFTSIDLAIGCFVNVIYATITINNQINQLIRTNCDNSNNEFGFFVVLCGYQQLYICIIFQIIPVTILNVCFTFRYFLHIYYQ